LPLVAERVEDGPALRVAELGEHLLHPAHDLGVLRAGGAQHERPRARRHVDRLAFPTQVRVHAIRSFGMRVCDSRFATYSRHCGFRYFTPATGARGTSERRSHDGDTPISVAASWSDSGQSVSPAITRRRSSARSSGVTGRASSRAVTAPSPASARTTRC